jgi:hypothetical protein
MDVTINGIKLIGNESNITMSTSVLAESHPWLLRDFALNARTETGQRPVEVETLSGRRVLVESSKGTYHDVPRNNDDVIFQTNATYALLLVAISVEAISASTVANLPAAHRASIKYYTDRRILLAKISDNGLSYVKRMALLAEYNALAHTGLTVSIAGLDGSNWEFAETNGLNISYWSNGPYADVKLSLVSKKQIDL